MVGRGAGSPRSDSTVMPLRSQALGLGRVVGHQPHRADADRARARRGVGVVAEVGLQAEPQVRVDGVGAGVLLDVCAQLVDQADPPALVAVEVQHDAAALGGDAPQRGTAAARRSRSAASRARRR